MKKINIWTDGSCKGNPGPGGWAAILEYNGKTKSISGSVQSTTNNRMELAACYHAIKAIKVPCEIVIHSDSTYVCNGFEKAQAWKRSGWMNSVGKPVANSECWNYILRAVAEGKHQIAFEKVPAHADDINNNLVDLMAQREALELKKKLANDAALAMQTKLEAKSDPAPVAKSNPAPVAKADVTPKAKSFVPAFIQEADKRAKAKMQAEAKAKQAAAKV